MVSALALVMLTDAVVANTLTDSAVISPALSVAPGAVIFTPLVPTAWARITMRPSPALSPEAFTLAPACASTVPWVDARSTSPPFAPVALEDASMLAPDRSVRSSRALSCTTPPRAAVAAITAPLSKVSLPPSALRRTRAAVRPVLRAWLPSRTRTSTSRCEPPSLMAFTRAFSP